MRNKLLYIICAVLATLTLTTACKNSGKWTVEGTIDGAADRTILLEASNQGRWYTLDSTTIDSKGSFKMTQVPVGYPDIYRLTLDGKSIYFPIDSIESVKIESSLNGFGDQYNISGSERATQLLEVDHLIATAVKTHGVAAANDSTLKRALSQRVVDDPSGVVAYYIINKRIGDNLIFDPAQRGDLRIIGAVANAFDQLRPNDPRTRYLRDLFISYRHAANGPTTVAVEEVPLIDFALPDVTGHVQSLSGIASQGKVVILNFTVYDADPSPGFNRELSKIYDSYHDRGLEIVQVSVDDDQFAWSRSARNLPWVTLYATEGDRTNLLMTYNVGAVPASFVINRRGEIVERVDDIERLPSVVAKYL